MSEPIRSPYTVPYGAQFGAPREGGRHHQGTDYHCPIGTPIYAVGDGRVVSNVGETGVGIGFGNYVSVKYPNGMMTLDGHLRERSSLAVGTLVNDQTVLAYVGITGNAIYSDPPGSHDHHQVWINGALVDPQSIHTSTAGGTSTPIPEDDMFSDSDRALLEDVRNKLSVSGQVYGLPQVIQQRVDTIVAKLEVPDQGYDWLPAISNQINSLPTAIANAVIAKLPAGATVDTAAVVAAITAVLPTHITGTLN